MHRAAAFAVLALLIAVPFLVGLWLLFPVAAGMCVYGLFRKSSQTFQKYVKPILGIVLLAFVAWAWFRPFRPAATASVTASPINRALSGGGAEDAASTADPIAEARRVLRRELLVEHFKVQKLASAIDTVRVADAAFASQTQRAQADAAGLSQALEELRSSLESTRAPASELNLLNPEALRGVAAAIQSDLKQIETAETAATSREALIGLQDKLPGLLSRYNVAAVPTRLVRLENALRASLKANLKEDTVHTARFDRSSGELICEQRTTLSIQDNQAASVDLSNFFASGLGATGQRVSLQEDGSSPVCVNADGSGCAPGRTPIKLGLKTERLSVTRSVPLSGVSHPILGSRYFLPGFRSIEVKWPDSAFPAIVLNMRLPNNPDRTWPWTVKTDEPARFAGVEIPGNSFLYANPPATAADINAGTTLLSFRPEDSLSAVGLSAGQRATVEILPAYLSMSPVQNAKQYLVVENAMAALILLVISTAITAWAGP